MEEIGKMLIDRKDVWIDEWINQCKKKHQLTDGICVYMQKEIELCCADEMVLKNVKENLLLQNDAIIGDESLSFTIYEEIIQPFVEILEPKLPLGTVFTAKWENEVSKDYEHIQFVIVGRYARPNVEGSFYTDYQTVVYPFGMMELNQYYYFNHEEVNKVTHMGLQSEEDREYSIFIQYEYLIKMHTKKIRTMKDIQVKKEGF